MSRIALVTYDLKDTKSGDNVRAKQALVDAGSVYTAKAGFNTLSSFPQWVKIDLPNTTLLAEVDDSVTTEEICADVKRIITSTGSTPDKIFVCFIDYSSDFLYEAP